MSASVATFQFLSFYLSPEFLAQRNLSPSPGLDFSDSLSAGRYGPLISSECFLTSFEGEKS